MTQRFITIAAILEKMRKTLIDRGEVYGDKWDTAGDIISALYPQGVPQELVTTDRWFSFYMIIAKLVRYAHSNNTHEDSMHDIANYAAITEMLTANHNLYNALTVDAPPTHFPLSTSTIVADDNEFCTCNTTGGYTTCYKHNENARKLRAERAKDEDNSL